jgi:hypothetical protein
MSNVDTYRITHDNVIDITEKGGITSRINLHKVPGRVADAVRSKNRWKLTFLPSSRLPT